MDKRPLGAERRREIELYMRGVPCFSITATLVADILSAEAYERERADDNYNSLERVKGKFSDATDEVKLLTAQLAKAR